MNLLMLTKTYPFGSGEAFIENEITVFSQHYDNVYIIACDVPKDEKKVRKLPHNVKVYRIDSINKNKDRLSGASHYLLSNEPDIKAERKACKGFMQKLFLSYFEAKSRRIFKTILQSGILDTAASFPYVLYSYWLFVTARVGTLISEQFRPVYMFTRAHRYDLYADKNKLGYLPFRRLLLSRYNEIFPCSDDGTHYLCDKYPEFSDKISTSFLGTIDHGDGRLSSDGIFRIYSCSRVVSVKRVERIAEALKLLDGKNLKIQWTHIGGGEQLEAVKNLAQNSLKSIEYQFLGDTPNQKVLEIYSNDPVDLFINVSSSEGLPVSIMEAVSFGVPVIGTDVGGTSEIVFNGLTGLLIPENFTNEELSEKIEYFYSIHETEKYQKYRKDCREFWEEHFQAIKNYEKLCGHIEEKCSG